MYLWRYRAEIEVIVQQTPVETATAVLDVGTALSSDRSLGGLVDWVEWSAPPA